MKLTETEARKRKCPLAILLAAGDVERLQGAAAGGVPVGIWCQGSGCAAWRWFDQPNGDGNTYMPPEYVNGSVPGKASDPGTGARHDWRERAARGYCGLAGRPE